MYTRTQDRGAVTPQETDPDLPLSVQESHWRCGPLVARCQVRGTECSSECIGAFEGVTIFFITSTIIWSQVKQQGGNTAPPITKSWIKNKTQFPPQSVCPIRKLP